MHAIDVKSSRMRFQVQRAQHENPVKRITTIFSYYVNPKPDNNVETPARLGKSASQSFP
jgi:hypothetical protein